MIKLQQGDILQADVEALVNTVNCVGIMGRGIALQFREEFPENYRAYKAACDRGELQPGKMLVFDVNRFEHPRFIINFPTKRHWRGKSRIEDIQAGLKALIEEVWRLKIRSIAIPPLGCGLGGLDWDEVRPMIEQAFHELPEVRVLIYEPAGAPPVEERAKEKKAPNMTIARATLLGLIRRYLAAMMDPSVSLLEIHKLMYFMQESGEPLKLKYNKGPYGPYAENLRHVLSAIDGYFISGYGDVEDDPDKQIELMANAAERAEAFLKEYPDTQARFDRVANLIDGFETSFGMELLATVHWVASREKAANLSDIAAIVYSWNDRKRMFKERQIQIAWELLNRKGWVSN